MRDMAFESQLSAYISQQKSKIKQMMAHTIIKCNVKDGLGIEKIRINSPITSEDI